MADSDGDGRGPEGARPVGAVEPPGEPEPDGRGSALADRDGDGRQQQPTPRVHGEGSLWNHPLGRHRFPPLRGDDEGWARWVAAGGPEPALRRGHDGISGGLDEPAVEADLVDVQDDDAGNNEQLAALGNAVVPQDAYAVGLFVAEIFRRYNVVLR
jgi:hypothetical protein